MAKICQISQTFLSKRRNFKLESDEGELYALNYHWYEPANYVPQAVLNYSICRDFIANKVWQLRDQFCILTKMKKSVAMAMFNIRILSVFTLQFASLQHVTHK